jgi:hypothetical protein
MKPELAIYSSAKTPKTIAGFTRVCIKYPQISFEPLGRFS